MRVWEHRDETGHVCAIEIPSLASRRRVTRLLSQVPGVRVVRWPKLFSWIHEEVFCEFDLDGERYTITEPFGDNSRYWIGKASFGWHASFPKIVDLFQRSGLWFD